MKRVFDHLRDGLLQRAGLAEQIGHMPSLDSLRRTEWSSEFEQRMRYHVERMRQIRHSSEPVWNSEFEALMRRRLVFGAMRYGLMGAPDKPNYDRMGSIERRVQIYLDTGNTEPFVDIANLAMMEYVEAPRPFSQDSTAVAPWKRQKRAKTHPEFILQVSAYHRRRGSDLNLIYIAISALQEFNAPSHPSAHFEAADGGEHVTVKS